MYVNGTEMQRTRLLDLHCGQNWKIEHNAPDTQMMGVLLEQMKASLPNKLNSPLKSSEYGVKKEKAHTR
jgi:hypothetical protein